MTNAPYGGTGDGGTYATQPDNCFNAARVNGVDMCGRHYRPYAECEKVNERIRDLEASLRMTQEVLAVARDVAHQYEQERDEALAEVEKQKELYALRVEMEQAAYFPMREERDAMRAERDAAREQAKGLAEALRKIDDFCDAGIALGDRHIQSVAREALAAFDKENEHADTD